MHPTATAPHSCCAGRWDTAAPRVGKGPGTWVRWAAPVSPRRHPPISSGTPSPSGGAGTNALSVAQSPREDAPPLPSGEGLDTPARDRSGRRAILRGLRLGRAACRASASASQRDFRRGRAGRLRKGPFAVWGQARETGTGQGQPGECRGGRWASVPWQGSSCHPAHLSPGSPAR